MKILKLCMVFFALSLFVFATSTVLILDASGSMEETLDSGKTRIDTAKEAANVFLNNVRSGDEVALIVYYDCDDIKTEVPFTTDLAQIRTKIATVEPDSWTPIARALTYAGQYASNSGRTGANIILLTDGEETCDSQSDAVSAAQNTVAGPIKVINVVGFAISNSSGAYQDLIEIAAAGKGKYYPAQDADELASSLTQAYNEGGGGICCLPAFMLLGLVYAGVFLSARN